MNWCFAKNRTIQNNRRFGFNFKPPRHQSMANWSLQKSAGIPLPLSLALKGFVDGPLCLPCQAYLSPYRRPLGLPALPQMTFPLCVLPLTFPFAWDFFPIFVNCLSKIHGLSLKSTSSLNFILPVKDLERGHVLVSQLLDFIFYMIPQKP